MMAGTILTDQIGECYAEFQRNHVTVVSSLNLVIQTAVWYCASSRRLRWDAVAIFRTML